MTPSPFHVPVFLIVGLVHLWVARWLQHDLRVPPIAGTDEVVHKLGKGRPMNIQSAAKHAFTPPIRYATAGVVGGAAAWDVGRDVEHEKGFGDQAKFDIAVIGGLGIAGAVIGGRKGLHTISTWGKATVGGVATGAGLGYIYGKHPDSPLVREIGPK